MSDESPHNAPLDASVNAPVLEHEPSSATVNQTRPAREAATRPLWIAFIILLIVAAMGGFLLWSDGQARNAQLAALGGQLADANTRLGRLEAVPPPPPPVDIAPLQGAIAGLEGRLTALANKPPPQATLNEAGRQQIAALAGRIDSIGARQDQLGTAEQGDLVKLNDQIAALTAKVTALAAQADASTKASSAVSALSAREARTAQMGAAAAALAAGRPLGDLADAPPALAKFATQAPPTEASLRLSFDAAAQAARSAGQPTPETVPFFRRMWQRAESSVTVKAGNTLVVGDALSGTLDHARQLLDAGDLSGAVTALDGRSGPAAQAMAPWRAQAQSLLDARAALITAAQH